MPPAFPVAGNEGRSQAFEPGDFRRYRVGLQIQMHARRMADPLKKELAFAQARSATG